MKRKQGLFFFLSSCVPGCGQMHQGYMKRGMSLLMIFCCIFVLAMFLGLDYLLIFFIPLWLFSFFDSYNLRTQLDLGTASPDAALLGLSALDSAQLSALFRKRHSLIGWSLVLFGAYALYSQVMRRLLSALINWFPWLDWLYGLLIHDLPRMVVTIGIIALGVWFIRGPKAPPAEDIPAFTPPEEEEAAHDAH